MSEKKTGKGIDIICGLTALVSIAALFVPFARDISVSEPIEILSLSVFQFGLSSANGKLLGNDYTVVGIVTLVFLGVIALLLLMWAIRSFIHHEKAGKNGLIATILNTLITVVAVMILSHSREFTAGLAVLLVIIGIAGIVLSIIQIRSRKGKNSDG